MSPTQLLAMSYRVADRAIAEMVCADNQLTKERAAALLANAAFATVRSAKGSEAAAEAAYAIGDHLVGTPG